MIQFIICWGTPWRSKLLAVGLLNLYITNGIPHSVDNEYYQGDHGQEDRWHSPNDYSNCSLLQVSNFCWKNQYKCIIFLYADSLSNFWNFLALSRSVVVGVLAKYVYINQIQFFCLVQPRYFFITPLHEFVVVVLASLSVIDYNTSALCETTGFNRQPPNQVQWYCFNKLVKREAVLKEVQLSHHHHQPHTTPNFVWFWTSVLCSAADGHRKITQGILVPFK